jgi:hypothetical protein
VLPVAAARPSDPPAATPPLPPSPLPPPHRRRWDALAAAGWADPSDVYIATNALFYKYLEHWGFSKGVHVSHIVNSGRTLGDARCVPRPPPGDHHSPAPARSAALRRGP